MNNPNELKHEFGIRSCLYTGLAAPLHPTPWTSSEAATLRAKHGDDVEYPHPVAKLIARRGTGMEQAERMRTLAATDGIHAPLRLALERHMVNRIQPRLPGLHSYHPLLAQLDGTLDDIDVSDFLNPAEDAESVGMPHLMMERRLGLL